MTPRSVQEYAAALWPRYRSSTRSQKSALLDEAEQVTGYTKRFDPAATAYRRLLASSVIKSKDRRALETIYRSINPVALRKEIDQHRHMLWKLATHTDR